MQVVAPTVEERFPFSIARCNEKMDDFALASAVGRSWPNHGHRYVILTG